MTSREKLLALAASMPAKDLPPGVTRAQLEAWVAAHAGRLLGAVDRDRGHAYRIAGRWYLDTRGVQRLAGHFTAVPGPHGEWQVLHDKETLALRPVTDMPRLPGQEGALLRVRGSQAPSVAALLQSFVDAELLVLVDTWDTWPPGPAKPPCGGCGSSCGCGPCRHAHGPKETP